MSTKSTSDLDHAQFATLLSFLDNFGQYIGVEDITYTDLQSFLSGSQGIGLIFGGISSVVMHHPCHALSNFRAIFSVRRKCHLTICINTVSCLNVTKEEN